MLTVVTKTKQLNVFFYLRGPLQVPWFETRCFRSFQTTRSDEPKASPSRRRASAGQLPLRCPLQQLEVDQTITKEVKYNNLWFLFALKIFFLTNCRRKTRSVFSFSLSSSNCSSSLMGNGISSSSLVLCSASSRTCLLRRFNSFNMDLLKLFRSLFSLEMVISCLWTNCWCVSTGKAFGCEGGTCRAAGISADELVPGEGLSKRRRSRPPDGPPRSPELSRRSKLLRWRSSTTLKAKLLVKESISSTSSKGSTVVVRARASRRWCCNWYYRTNRSVVMGGRESCSTLIPWRKLLSVFVMIHKIVRGGIV